MDPSRARSVPSRIGLVLVALALATVGLVTVPTRALAADPCAPAVNPVACENSKPGTTDWYVAPDTSIEGFATEMSVDNGQRIDFKIRTDAPDYRVDLYRLGWYGGDGGRLVDSVRPSAPLPQTQPDCLREPATGLVDCGNWAVSASWAVPADAVSGVYSAVLRRSDTGTANQIVFVVRDDASRSDLVFQTSDTTWAAYNVWGGASLYTGDGPGRGGRAYAVSYNRPLAGHETGELKYFEYPMIRFLEANGYDVSYISGIDTHRSGGLLTNHRTFLSVGHDEYWSGAQRANVEAARAAGVHLAFFSGNEVYWRVRWEDSIDGSGQSHRTMVSYKESLDGRRTDPSGEWTGLWRDPRFRQPGIEPENALTGQQYKVNGNGVGTRADSIAVPAEFGAMRLWRDTAVAGQAAGQTYTFGAGTLGYEWDADFDNGFRPAGLARLSESVVDVAEPDVLQDDFGVTLTPDTVTHHLTLYRDQGSGALVFGAGTIQWTWGLDDDHGGAGRVANTPMRQATVNLFADMGVQPATLQGDLRRASASTDTTPPTVAITAPPAADTVTVGSPVTVGGTATDVGGVVAGVEVSVDGGATWHPAEGRAEWSYTWTPAASGPLALQVRAVDDSARLSAPVTYDGSVSQRTCPCTIWPDSAVPRTPATADATPVELGVRWQSQVAGYVTGVRFYKGPGNSGTHTGSLWTADGRLLATGTFTDETTTGWQTLTFPSAVPVEAGTTYVASYHAPVGRYAADANAFELAGVTNEPLTALGGPQAGNGVYRLGPGFPDNTHQATNYWVDVVFQATAPPDTRAPVATAGSPLDGSTSVPPTTAVTAVFDEPVEATTIRLELTGAAGSPIAGATTYDPGTRTATFTPAEQLAPGTRFTATVRAAQDTAGNALAAPVTWSFTTMRAPATPGVCPCSIWDDTVVPAVVSVVDPSAVELGTRFRADTDGTVTGIRFYKGPQNTGTHTGTLWSADGRVLARATFGSESASGWQEAALDRPVEITAGTTYVVSYHTTSGWYSVTSGGLSGGVTSGPLTALADGLDGPNGVYAYGAGGFPTQPAGGANYWVDLVFQPAPDVLPPTVTGTSPGAGASSVPVDAVVTATMSEAVDPATATLTLTGADGAPVPGTTTYQPAGRTVRFTPSAPLAAATGYTATVSGVADVSGNVMSGARTWSFTTAGLAACPCTLFSDAVPGTPATDDGRAVELGTRLRFDADGWVAGVRFYKGPGNTGTHTGSLWTSDGTRLATGTFVDETATGWQELRFANPVPVTAGTTYVASYHAPNGHYAVDVDSFATDGRSNPPVHALRNGEDGPNGVFTYGPASSFPERSHRSANYWVDAVFVTTAPADVTPPQVVSTSPGDGWTDVAVTSPVQFSFDEAVQPATAVVQVTTAQGAAVPGTVSAVGQRLLLFRPEASLPPGTTVTATVSGVQDTAGNVLAAPVTISFTTAAGQAAGCPCSLFPDGRTPEVAAAADTSAAELGVRFRTDLSGVVTGVRFFKGPGNTGTHTGSLWAPDGTLLATATFVAETAGGWQQVLFDQPVPVAAGVTYTASYHTEVGRYSYTRGAFESAGVDRAPLHAPQATATEPNGVYVYGASAMPTRGTSTDYHVDVVFETDENSAPPPPPPGADTTPPSVSSTAPAAGASGVPTGSPVSAVLTEPVTASSLQFSLSGPAGPVPAVVGLDSTGTRVTASPSSPLAPATQYTAALAAADRAGNAMASPVTWAFTTADDASPPTAGGCPCTLFTDADVPAATADGDTSPVELGVRFSADTSGVVTGVRFFKGPGNTGTHTGSLWAPDGTLLATATFVAETAGGWQQVLFDQPVPVAAGVTYTASYHTEVGRYSYTRGAFESAGVDRAPLHAPQATATEPNGVYVYGASAMPTRGTSTNYHVDVLFTPQEPPVAAAAVAPEPSPEPAGSTSTPAPGEPTLSEAPAASGEPSSSSPETTAPETTAPETTAPETTAPETTAPETTAPGTTAPPSSSAPSTSAPSSSTPETTAPESSAPESSAPESSAPSSTAPPSTSAPAPSTGEAPAPAPVSLFTEADVPPERAVDDTTPAELGTRFTTAADVWVTALRVATGTGATGTLVGSLWTADGQRLASVRFADITEPGWQTAVLGQPVALRAGEEYVVSHTAPEGRWTETAGGAATDRTSGPLTAPADRASAPNGVRGPAGAFPTEPAGGAAFWVDVVAATVEPPGAAADTARPTVTATGPEATALFSEPVEGVRMTLTGPDGTEVPAALVWDPRTLVARLEPAQVLEPGTTWTVTVSAARDAAGNDLAGPVTWTVTT